MHSPEQPTPNTKISEHPTAPDNIPNQHNDISLDICSSDPEFDPHQQLTISPANPNSSPTNHSVNNAEQSGETNESQQSNTSSVKFEVYPFYQQCVIQTPPVSDEADQYATNAATVTQPKRGTLHCTYAFWCCFGTLGLIAFIFAGKLFYE